MVERRENEHGHGGAWKLDPHDEKANVWLWGDRDLVVLRALNRTFDDPVELTAPEALEVAIALLGRVREIERTERDEDNVDAWRRLSRLASSGEGE